MVNSYHCHALFDNFLGRLTYFLGASKGTDETRRIYDPISKTEGYICSFSKRELQDIGKYNNIDRLVY